MLIEILKFCLEACQNPAKLDPNVRICGINMINLLKNIPELQRKQLSHINYINLLMCAVMENNIW